MVSSKSKSTATCLPLVCSEMLPRPPVPRSRISSAAHLFVLPLVQTHSQQICCKSKGEGGEDGEKANVWKGPSFPPSFPSFFLFFPLPSLSLPSLHLCSLSLPLPPSLPHLQLSSYCRLLASRRLRSANKSDNSRCTMASSASVMRSRVRMSRADIPAARQIGQINKDRQRGTD